MIEQIEMEMSQMCEDEKTMDFCMSVFQIKEQSGFDYGRILQLARLIQYDSTVAHSFLGGLYKIAQADGKKLFRAANQNLTYQETELKLPKGTLLSWVRSGFNPRTFIHKKTRHHQNRTSLCRNRSRKRM